MARFLGRQNSDVAGAKGTGKWMSRWFSTWVCLALWDHGCLCSRIICSERGESSSERKTEWPKSILKPELTAAACALVGDRAVSLKPSGSALRPPRLSLRAGSCNCKRLAEHDWDLITDTPLCFGVEVVSSEPSSSMDQRAFDSDANLENLLDPFFEEAVENAQRPGELWFRLCARHSRPGLQCRPMLLRWLPARTSPCKPVAGAT